MRYHLARLLRALADQLDPHRSITVTVTGDRQSARRAILEAETAIRRHSRGWDRRGVA